MINIVLWLEGWRNQIIIIWNALPRPIKDAFDNVLNWIKNTWSSISDWFRTRVTEPIKNAFTNALNGIRDNFTNVFNGILNFVSGVVDRIQNMINLISSIGNLLNVSPTYYNTPISTYGYDGGYQPPRLATGAVIPPNAQFAAILGDQKSGTNIEAPADLIRQIVMDAINSNQQQTNVSVSFEGTLGALVRELQPHIKAENIRVGGSLKR